MTSSLELWSIVRSQMLKTGVHQYLILWFLLLVNCGFPSLCLYFLFQEVQDGFQNTPQTKIILSFVIYYWLLIGAAWRHYFVNLPLICLLLLKKEDQVSVSKHGRLFTPSMVCLCSWRLRVELSCRPSTRAPSLVVLWASLLLPLPPPGLAGLTTCQHSLRGYSNHS